MQRDFLDLAGKSLSKIDNSIKDSTIIDKFIHELQDYFTKLQSEENKCTKKQQ